MAASKAIPIATKSIVSSILGNRSTCALTKGSRLLASQRKGQQERSLSNFPLAKYVCHKCIWAYSVISNDLVAPFVIKRNAEWS